jgi:protein-tyrosine phosphatase
MVDLHCHLLPEVDDGASSWEMSEEMCRVAAEDGITHIVATPHANDEYVYDRERHAETVRELSVRVGTVPQISLGCDFHFSYENVQAALADPARYTIGATAYLLIELSDYSVPPNILSNFQQLMGKGLRLVLTHPERNPLLQRRPQRVLEWVREGVIVQVTANALTGAWGRTAQQVASWLLEHDAVHVVASDAHDPVRRPPRLSVARDLLEERRGQEVATALVETNPGAIVRGSDLPYFPAPLR